MLFFKIILESFVSRKCFRSAGTILQEGSYEERQTHMPFIDEALARPTCVGSTSSHHKQASAVLDAINEAQCKIPPRRQVPFLR